MKIFILFIFIIMQSVLLSCSTAINDNDAKVESTVDLISMRKQRIRIKQESDAFIFYDDSSEMQFMPMGYNYAHVQEVSYSGVKFSSHSTFSSEHYDEQASDKVLRKLKNAGFNTVRVFINPALIATAKGSLNHTYIVNLSDFIIKADNLNLSVIITTDLAPIAYYNKPVSVEEDVTWLNSQYIDQEEIDNEAEYWVTLISSLRAQMVPLEAILSYEIRNEFFFNPNFEPFLSELTVTLTNGQIYDLSDQIQKNAMIDASFLNWSSTIINAIKAEDADALVSVGFFAPEVIGTPAIVAINESNLDFVDIHLYESTATLEQYAEYFDLVNQKNKLIIMGEFGYIENGGLNINQISDNLFKFKEKAVSQYQLDGWLIWTWDSNVGGRLSVTDENQTLFNQMSPIKQ